MFAEVLVNHGIIRSRSHPLRKRTRSPSPCAHEIKTEPSRKRSRSAPSGLGTEDSFRLGSPFVPYYDCPRTLSAPRPTYPLPIMPSIASMDVQVNGLLMAPVGVGWPNAEDSDLDSDDELLLRVEVEY